MPSGAGRATRATVWLLATGAIGCGRIGFDALSTDAGAGSDGGPSMDASVDGDVLRADGGAHPDSAIVDSAVTDAGPLRIVTPGWTRVPMTASQAVGYAVAIGPDGNIVTVGIDRVAIDLGGGPLPRRGAFDEFVASWAADGTYEWAVPLASTGNDTPLTVTAARDGTVVVGGDYGATIDFGGGARTNLGDYDAFLVAYDRDATYLWDRVYGGPGTEECEHTLHPAGGVLAACAFTSPVDFGGGTRMSAGSQATDLLELTSAGAYVSDSLILPVSGQAAGGRLVAGISDRRVAAGYFTDRIDFGGGVRSTSRANVDDIFLVAYAPDGTYAWDHTYGGMQQDLFNEIVMAPTGEIFLAGDCQQSCDLGAGNRTVMSIGGFVVALDPSGGYRWSRWMDGPGIDRTLDVALARDGSVVTAGYFEGTVDFGNGPRTSAGGSDIFVAAYSSAGAPLWDRTFGGTGGDIAWAVATDDAGTVVIAGTFSETVDFGDGPRTRAGTSDFFVATFAP